MGKSWGAYGTLQENNVSKSAQIKGNIRSRSAILTRHNISGIQLVVIFDEAETAHQLDLRDLARAMAAEMFLDVAFSH